MTEGTPPGKSLLSALAIDDMTATTQVKTSINNTDGTLRTNTVSPFLLRIALSLLAFGAISPLLPPPARYCMRGGSHPRWHDKLFTMRAVCGSVLLPQSFQDA